MKAVFKSTRTKRQNGIKIFFIYFIGNYQGGFQMKFL
jgi:hypothetical protein